MREFVKRLLPYLPLGMRRIIEVIALHGWGLFWEKPNFKGEYKSFADVPALTVVVEHELAQTARLGAKAPRLDELTGFPKLRLSHELLPVVASMLGPSPRILDFGGAAGNDFHNMIYAMPKGSHWQYHVIDLPAVCEAGRDIWKGDDRITFSFELPPSGDGFDLIWSWSGIHLVAEPLALLERFAEFRPQAMLFVASPFT